MDVLGTIHKCLFVCVWQYISEANEVDGVVIRKYLERVMGILIAQIYWPIWLAFRHFGHSYIGMVVGFVVVNFLFCLWWKIEFGKWRWWVSL